MVFGNGVKNIKAAAYNGARTVYGFRIFQAYHDLLTPPLVLSLYPVVSVFGISGKKYIY